MIEDGGRRGRTMADKRQLFTDMKAQNFDLIRLSTYRTACKLRFVQKKCNLHLVDVWNMIEAFRDNGLNTLEHSTELSVSRLETIVSSVYYQLNKRLPTTYQIDVQQSISLLLNFLLAAHGSEGQGSVTVFSVKVMLAILCGGKIVDKLRYIFSQISDSHGAMTISKFDLFLLEALKLPSAVFEGPSFGYTQHFARSCFPQQKKVMLNTFLDTMMSDPPPQCLVWLPLMHRLANVENVRPAAESPGVAAAPEQTESEPQAQPAAQKPTGATITPEEFCAAEPVMVKSCSAELVSVRHGGTDQDQEKPCLTELDLERSCSVDSGAVLELPVLAEAGTEVQSCRLEAPVTTPVQEDGGDVEMEDEPTFKYTLNITRDIVRSLKGLEIEIVELQRLEATGNQGHIEALKSKKAKMNDLLDVTAQGALVRSSFTSVTEMDAPSKLFPCSFFFSLEQKNGQKRFIHAVRTESGDLLSEPTEIRKQTVRFYSKLYSSERSGAQIVEESFLKDLPKLSEQAARELDRELTLAEPDQEKAFDRVEHEYLWKVLETYGFNPGFIAMVKGANAGHQQPSPSLWHKLACVDPPPNLLASIQALLVDFFWDGLHWIPQSVLHLHKEEGGQGLVQLASRAAAFRLQFLQRLLTGPKDLIWRPVAHGLLHNVGGLGLDRTLFLMDTKTLDFLDYRVFTVDFLKNWNCFRKRNKGCGTLHWLLEEPLIHGRHLDISGVTAPALSRALISSRVVTLRELVNIAGTDLSRAEDLAARLGLRSLRVVNQLLRRWRTVLTSKERVQLMDCQITETNPAEEGSFPQLEIAPDLDGSEVVHPVSCSYCRGESMVGFRYRCQQCFNYQLCQTCFWRGHASGNHSNQHQMKEHSSWKSPAKKLGHAISKSFGCVPSRELTHPIYPEDPERPLDLSNIVPPRPVPNNTSAPPPSGSPASSQRVPGIAAAQRLNEEHALIAAYVNKLQSSPRALDSPSRMDEEHKLIARYTSRLASDPANNARSPKLDFDTNKHQRQLIAELENKNREILQEIQRLRLEHEQASQPTPEKAQQNPTLLAELRLLRQRKDELEQRMSALQESRRELMVQLEGLMKLLKEEEQKQAAQAAGTPQTSPSHAASRPIPMPVRSTGSTPTHTGHAPSYVPQDSLAGVGGDVREAFAHGARRNLRNDLLVAADSITNTMSSLVKELHTEEDGVEEDERLRNGKDRDVMIW
ncbi:hypothetical protein QTP86_030099, partial [Hemibagrus guttatus]